MAMIVCPHCGEQVSEKAKKCVHCGAILIPEEKKHCTECGGELEEGMTECPNCGCPVEDTLGQETDEKPQHAQDFIAKREAPAFIPNDGKQTPTKGCTMSSGHRLCTDRSGA